MSTFVVVNTYAHSVTFVTDKMLMSLKEIIRCSGLSPEKMVEDWATLHRGISTWLNSEDLEAVYLEIFDPRTDVPIGRWDFDIYYGSGGGWRNVGRYRRHPLPHPQGRPVAFHVRLSNRADYQTWAAER